MEDKELMMNARKPVGELGQQLLNRMNKSHETMAVWGVSHFDVEDDDIILDIGCGGGVNIERFSKIASNGKVCGLDYSDVSVEMSKERNQEAVDSGLVEVLQGSVSEMPYEDETFDIVTAFETVYFWPDIENDLKEVNRVLKKGGLIFICNEVVEDDIENYRHMELAELLDMNIFSEEVYKSLLTEAGFGDFKAFRKEGEQWICILARKN